MNIKLETMDLHFNSKGMPLIDFAQDSGNYVLKNVPYLKKLSTSMKNKPFKVISVSIDCDWMPGKEL